MYIVLNFHKNPLVINSFLSYLKGITSLLTSYLWLFAAKYDTIYKMRWNLEIFYFRLRRRRLLAKEQRIFISEGNYRVGSWRITYEEKQHQVSWTNSSTPQAWRSLKTLKTMQSLFGSDIGHFLSIVFFNFCLWVIVLLLLVAAAADVDDIYLGNCMGECPERLCIQLLSCKSIRENQWIE